jgi:hypothetical protein
MIASEQNVVSLIGSYLTTLGAYWQAASDTAGILQTDDVYKVASDVTSLPEVDIAELLKLPCCHPCSSLKDVAVAPAAEPVLSPPRVLPSASVGAGPGVPEKRRAPSFEGRQPAPHPRLSPLLAPGAAAAPEQGSLPLPTNQAPALLGAPTVIRDDQTKEVLEGGTR